MNGLRLLTAALAAMLLAAGLPAQGRAVVGGRVMTITGPIIDDGVVLIRGGKIERVGTRADVPVPAGFEVIDATGCTVMPGMVELHNHTGISDINDMVYQVNPELRVLDNLELGTPAMNVALAGGVTTVLSIPGSGTNMGGFGVIRKTWGKQPEDVVVRFPGALKIAQAGNPERSTDLGSGRMGMNWLIRNVLLEGKAYNEAWKRYERGESPTAPPRNVRYEYLRGLFEREYPVAVHTQWMSVVQQTMRILHDELGLDVIIDHGTFDGYLNGPELAARGIPVANGPREFLWDTRQGRMIGLASAWHRLGIDSEHLAVNTDAPVIPQEELSFQATQAVRLGLPEDVALRALTINGARMLGVADRVGSLEAGKDADVVLWTGDPLDPRNRVRMALVNGEVAYDSARDGIIF